MVTPNENHIDENISIRTNRILKVLDETIKKAEIALSLPAFLKNLDRFANHLSEDEFICMSKCQIFQSQNTNEKEECLQSNYEQEIEVIALSNTIRKNSPPPSIQKEVQNTDLEQGKSITNGFKDKNVTMAIYILWKHPDLVYFTMTEYLRYSTESPGHIFLQNMHALRQCTYYRLMEDCSPEDMVKKILYYKDVWHKNDGTIRKINTLKNLLNDIMSRVEVEKNGRNKKMIEMQNRMKNFEINFREEIEKICTTSERNMVIEIKGSEMRQEDIHKDITKLEETYQNTLNGHLKREKELRVKRNKIETQLEACLDEYDNHLRERQAEYDEILAAYKDEQQQMETLQEKFDEQEKEYLILMEEKAYEEQLELERRIEDLRRRVAARIIQTHWRAMKQRRLERAKSRKAKKGKKGKKGRKKPKSRSKSKKSKQKGGSSPKSSRHGKRKT